MVDWDAVIKDDFAVPKGLTAAVDELAAMLTAADPMIRDGRAYEVLITWIRRGVLDDRLTALGGTMVARLSHAEVQARTFAPLILAAAVDRDAAADRHPLRYRPAITDAIASRLHLAFPAYPATRA
ncbi:unnamed protein product [[Actinomadura] parvosata subsp. kistnae]|uniref:Uncharacterized protein n=1 Tax=[Actinomadura] parvosata subsp. kistnae TaxID=1909395 RepID=A0A1V0A4P0_9ACTN|nr:hypothetical protein [Nonomuraea sp. ATCC 55076]AQZ65119.1 hypothetical protein BKM31_30040 [Nonomuraea sp. ATCC 55076]SPL96402.1 unnamed protein product [Actinomadura parvosata subsp. kistnae]